MLVHAPKVGLLTMICPYIWEQPHNPILAPHSYSLEAVLPAQGPRGRHARPCSMVKPANLNLTADPEAVWSGSSPSQPHSGANPAHSEVGELLGALPETQREPV